MQGQPLRTIAEDLGYSESTAHRRINAARRQLREELAMRSYDRTWVPFETETDPVLERAHRVFEDTYGALPSPDPRSGPQR